MPLEFFNRNFGRHLVDQTGDSVADARRALSGGHNMAKGGTPQRIASGWAVIAEGLATLQFKLAASGIQYSDATRYEAFLAALEGFSGPLMFLEFDKRPIPVSNLFRTHDIRCVKICSPRGVETFDWTKPPEKTSGKTHKVLWRMKHEPAKVKR